MQTGVSMQETGCGSRVVPFSRNPLTVSALLNLEEKLILMVTSSG